MTGLSTAMQRNWRRAGDLPGLGGAHNRFSAAEVVSIRLQVLLRRNGLGAEKARTAAALATPVVLYHLYGEPGAVEFNNTPSTLETRLRLTGIGGKQPPASWLMGDEAGMTLQDTAAPPEDVEAYVRINLKKVAQVIAERSTRPLLSVRKVTP